MKTSMLQNLIGDERGATAIEYGLICALIVIAIMASLNSFAGKSIAMWNFVSQTTANATGGTTG